MITCNTKLKLGYAWNAKCGSASFDQFIKNTGKKEDIIRLEQHICPDSNSIPTPSQCILDQSKCPLNKYKIFTFVRNPYTRAVSQYNHIIKNLKYTSPNKELQNKNMSFAEFIELLTRVDLRVDPHTRSQSAALPMEHIWYWNKIENLSDAIDVIYSNFAIQVPIPKINQSRIVNSTYVTPDQVFTPELKRMVYKLYQLDFDMFDYEQ